MSTDREYTTIEEFAASLDQLPDPPLDMTPIQNAIVEASQQIAEAVQDVLRIEVVGTSPAIVQAATDKIIESMGIPAETAQEQETNWNPVGMGQATLLDLGLGGTVIDLHGTNPTGEALAESVRNRILSGLGVPGELLQGQGNYSSSRTALNQFQEQAGLDRVKLFDFQRKIVDELIAIENRATAVNNAIRRFGAFIFQCGPVATIIRIRRIEGAPGPWDIDEPDIQPVDLPQGLWPAWYLLTAYLLDDLRKLCLGKETFPLNSTFDGGRKLLGEINSTNLLPYMSFSPVLCDLSRNADACAIIKAWSHQPWEKAHADALTDRLLEMGHERTAEHVRTFNAEPWRELLKEPRRAVRKCLKAWQEQLECLFGRYET